MNLAEKILVIEDKIVSYNLCSGGQGGFGYINKHRDHKAHAKKAAANRNNDYLRVPNHRLIASVIKAHKNGIHKNIYFKNNSQSLSKEVFEKRKMTYEKIQHQQGNKNSQFGTCWVTNGQDSKKIKKECLDEWINKGYIKGRK
jgi:hypothetical protein